jgi:hypothetical protein
MGEESGVALAVVIPGGNLLLPSPLLLSLLFWTDFARIGDPNRPRPPPMAHLQRRRSMAGHAPRRQLQSQTRHPTRPLPRPSLGQAKELITPCLGIDRSLPAGKEQ